MLIEKLVELMYMPILNMLDSIIQITIEFPVNIFNGLNSLMYGVGYILPLVQLMPILITSFAFYSFKIAWAIAMRVKSFIPTMGN